jgi:hypothetical protein
MFVIVSWNTALFKPVYMTKFEEATNVINTQKFDEYILTCVHKLILSGYKKREK